MFGSVMLDVAIGLITLYLLLSTICSTTAELVMNRLKPRAGLLQEAIQALFLRKDADPSQPQSPPAIARDLLRHGVTGTGHAGQPPNYIAPSAFASALIATLVPTDSAGQPTAPSLAQIKKQAALLPDSAVRDAVLTLVDQANGDLEKATKAIEQWYAEMMDRVSGIYKKHVQLVLLVSGFIFAAALNADTIMIARQLASGPAARAVVAQVAVELPASLAPNSSEPQRQLEKQLSQAQSMLAGSGLSLGWSNTPHDPRAWPWLPLTKGKLFDVAPEVAGAVVLKLIGLALTAAAVSFGAPFWFDLLNKVTNLRMGGRPPRDPRDEKVA